MDERFEEESKGMSRYVERNGNRAPFPSFPPLAANATPREVAVACANLVAEMVPKFQAMDQDLAETKAAALVASGASSRAEQASKRAEDVSVRAIAVCDRLEKRLDGPEIERRAQASVPAFNEAAESFASRVVAAVRDQRDGYGNITEDRVIELFDSTFDRRELLSVRKGRKWRADVLKGVVIAVVAGVVMLVIGEFHGRATGQTHTSAQAK